MWLEDGYYKGLDLFYGTDMSGAAKIYFTSDDLAILREREASGVIPAGLLDEFVTEDRVNINLAVQSIGFEYVEIAKIEAHIGDTASAHFYGRQPIVLSVNAMLLNDYANQSKHGLAELYRHALRLTAVARSKAAPCIEFVGATAQGAFLDLSFTTTSAVEDTVNVSFSFLVFQIVWVSEDNDGSSMKVKDVSILYNTPAAAEDLTIPYDVSVPDYVYNLPAPETLDVATESIEVSTPEANEARDTMSKIPVDMNISEIERQLRLHEGERLTTYYDTEGYLTVGIGHNLDAKQTSAIIGRNLKPGDTITLEESSKLFEYDLNKTVTQVYAAIPSFSSLSSARQSVLIDMAYNMGIGKTGQSGLLSFQTMLSAVEAGDYDAAADAMKNSKWYGQVGNRSKRLVYMMRNDKTFSETMA